MKWIIALIVVGLTIVGGVHYFRPLPEESIELTTPGLIWVWSLESYNGNKNIPGTLTFQEDGKFNAKICNSYVGSYEVSSGTLKFSEVMGTLMLCEDQALNKAENSFIQITGVKKQPTKTSFKNGKLELYNNTDVFIFTRD